MTELTGTATLIRLNLRRDRIWLTVWVVALAGLVLLAARAFEGLYPTQADLDSYAQTSGSSPAAVALNGPARALDTFGGAMVFEIGGYLAIAVALMNVFMIGRSTRAEEETGRLELLRAGVLGRHSSLTAALAVAVGINVVLAALIAGGLLVQGLPATGTLAFAGSLAALGLFFSSVAAVAVQVSEHVRGSYGIAGAVIGASYVLRATGDVGGNGLSWLSPFGWGQATRPYTGERWWPLLILLGAAAISVTVAAVLEARRDVGAGLVAARPGPGSARPGLLHQVGFSLRLQRASLIGWGVGVFGGGLAFGSVGLEMEEMLSDNTGLQDWVGAYGSDATDAFFALVLLILALTAAACALTSTLRVTTEENAGRVEPILATVISRPGWLLSHLVAPLSAAVVVSAAAGLGAGLAHGVRTADLAEIPQMIGGSLAHVPVIWLITGIAVLLVGALPRAASLAWAVFAGSVVVSMFGSLFQLPDWFTTLSPFEHTPRIPGGNVETGTLLALTAVAAALITLGVASFRRRDVH